jgi:hypothetical protein
MHFLIFRKCPPTTCTLYRKSFFERFLIKILFMRNHLLLIAGLIFLTISAVAQQTITGKVTDSKGIPLPGVSVKVKGTSRGTSTNDVGNFSIQGCFE